jgi:hypothetical protein
VPALEWMKGEAGQHANQRQCRLWFRLLGARRLKAPPSSIGKSAGSSVRGDDAMIIEKRFLPSAIAFLQPTCCVWPLCYNTR